MFKLKKLMNTNKKENRFLERKLLVELDKKQLEQQGSVLQSKYQFSETI